MNVSISEARDRLVDLVRRAEAGHDVILTQDGRPIAQLTALAVSPVPEINREERLRLIHDMQRRVSAKGPPDTSAARSQDFLYDEYGLPK